MMKALITYTMESPRFKSKERIIEINSLDDLIKLRQKEDNELIIVEADNRKVIPLEIEVYNNYRE